MKIHCLIALLVLNTLLGTSARAAIIAVDTFDYPAGSANGLSGGTGFSNSYSGAGNISAGSLGYTDTNGGAMPVSSNRFTTAVSSATFRTLTTIGQPPGVIDGSGFGASGAVIYIAFLARLETGSNAHFGGFSLFGDVAEQLFIGDTAGSTNWGLHVYDYDFQGFQTNSFTTNSAVPVDNTTHLFVTRIDFAAGAETIRFYIDPPLAGEPAVPTVGPVTKADFRFNRIRFASGSAGTHSFDELRMGTSYADVVKQPPVPIIQQPTNQIVFAGSIATFTVSATTTNPPLRYQWRFNGTNIAGATNDSLTISNVQPANAGGYDVLVRDAVGLSGSDLAILNLFAPFITAQPTNLAVRVSSNATFIVIADGAPPLSYQWQFNGTNLFNKTNATLLLTNVQLSQFGSYAVIITNNHGAATSSVVTLQLLQVPTIVQEPQPVTAVEGENATFTVVVTNTATLPITYRWVRNGVNFLTNVLDSTSCTLTLVDVRTNTVGLTNGAGRFYVRVINAAGFASSHTSFSVLTVIPAVAPSVVTLAATNIGGTSATLTGTVNPRGATTSARFEYGLTASYGSSTPTFAVGNDTNSITVSNPVTGLSPGTAYHFRLVAGNAGGTNFGGDQTFTTSATPLALTLTSPAKQGAQFSVSITTVIGATYHMECTPSLGTTNWTAVANVSGNGFVQNLIDFSATNAQSFYRVRVE